MRQGVFDPTFHPPIALAAFGDCIEHLIIGQDACVTSECQAVTSGDFDPEFGGYPFLSQNMGKILTVFIY